MAQRYKFSIESKSFPLDISGEPAQGASIVERDIGTIPTCEMLHIAVSIILVNQMAKLVIVEKSYQLGDNVFVFVHRAVSLITAKVQNQIVAPLKSHTKDCISINSKSD